MAGGAAGAGADGVHSGEAAETAAGLVGLDVHRAARVAAAGYGGQVLVSEAAAALVRGAVPGAALADLGVHRLKDLDQPVRIFQLRAAGLQAEFPPPRTVPGGVAAATRTLPRDLASFTGRQRELAELEAAAAVAGGVVGIHAIGGMAGVGKTAFAVHAAHRLADRFPAGQIFLPLHGHTPGQQPVDPADALASLLAAAGVPAGQVPPGLEARMALWRDRLAEKQLLLILDDAADSDQVRPLLPGTGRSLVLVTSRRHLSALEDATAVSLDTLPPGEAAGLLVRLAGRPGLSADDPAVGEIIRLCGFLPLAIGMVARQLHHHPAWSVTGRAAELATARDRLELMATENLSVAAAFNLSYADLSEDQARLFRRLGLHPGADIDGYAAAVLGGTDLAAARRGLEALYDQYLLSESARGRYRLHDLIREHARALAGRLDPEDDRDGATVRLLDYYQYTAARADALISRQVRPSSAAADGAAPAAVPALADSEQALAWARAERVSLLACLDHATGAGQHARVTALTASLAGLLRSDGPWTEAVSRHTAAVQAAGHLGDRLGQANAVTDLGVVRSLTDDYPAAAQVLEQALGIYRDLGDRLGLANALTAVGDVRRLTGDYPAAAGVLEQAWASSAISAVISRRLRDVTGRPWIWPALSPAPGTRLTHSPAWAGPLWPPATLVRQQACCGRRWGSSSRSARPKRPTFPPTSKLSPMRSRPRPNHHFRLRPRPDPTRPRGAYAPVTTGDSTSLVTFPDLGRSHATPGTASHHADRRNPARLRLWTLATCMSRMPRRAARTIELQRGDAPELPA